MKDRYTFRAAAAGKAFYDDLIATGHDLGVSMPVMESYSEAIRQFTT